MVVVQLAIQVVAVVVILVYIGVTNPEALQNPEAADELQTTIEQSMLELMAMISIPSVVITLGVVWLIRRFLDRRSLRSLGFQYPKEGWVSCWVLGILIGAVPMIAVAGLLYAMGGLEYKGWTISTLTLTLLIPGLLFAAFFEELVCRGYILKNFAEIDRVWLGIWFNSILFWLFHSLNPSAWQSPWVGINLVLAGVLLSLAYLAVDNLWFPTIVHFAWNFAQGPMLGIPVSGIQIGGMFDFELTEKLPVWVTGGQFGFEASAVCTLAELATCGVLYAYWKWCKAERMRDGQEI